MKFIAPPTETLKDYPDKVALLLFSVGCNYACGGCHARKAVYTKESIDSEKIIRIIDLILRNHSGWIDGVVICGGEPTIHNGLESFCEVMKEKGLTVKIDTNGSNPERLNRLIEKNLVDYLAMDMKGPLRLYERIANQKPEGIAKSLEIIGGFNQREIRTTFFPIIPELRWFTTEEMREMAEEIKTYSKDPTIKHYLQGFIGRSIEETIDPNYAQENLPPTMHRTPIKILEELHSEIKKILPNSRIRN